MEERQMSPAPANGQFRGRLQLCLAVSIGLLCGVSCMNIGIGNYGPDSPVYGTLKQEGVFHPLESTQGAVEVYYPRPYISPPNLQLSTNGSLHPVNDYVELIEQKPDHFTYRLKSNKLNIPPATIQFQWQSIGVPIAVPVNTTSYVTIAVPEPTVETTPVPPGGK